MDDIEKCLNYKDVESIADRIAKVEVYKSDKNPKKPQVGIGNIREILGIIADMSVADHSVLQTLKIYGTERVKVRASNKNADKITAAKKNKAK